MPEENTPDAPQVPTGYFTQAQIDEAVKAAKQAAREEERNKLYPQQTKTKEQLDTVAAELAELKKAEAARTKEAERIRAEAEKARKAKEDAELSAKDLLAKRDEEFKAQLAQMQQQQQEAQAAWQQQRELDQAMMAKEREMAALQLHIRDRVEAERENIAPELLDFIGGDTVEEVEASIERVKAKTAQIVEGMRQAQQAARAGMPGVSPSGGATAVVPGLDTGDQQLTADDIKGMSMQDFAALRQKMGLSAAGNGRGIFG